MLLPFGKAGRLRLEQLEPRDVPSRPLPLPVIYTGAESGAPPAVKAFDAETGGLTFERVVYEPAFTGGVRVATADITRDGFPDLIAAPGSGGGPRIHILDGKTGDQIPGPLGSFWAFAETFTGGVEVAAADVDGDQYPDVVAAAGPGGGPHVRVFSGKTGAEVYSFYALEPEFTGGIRVAAADFDWDTRADVAVGAGPGGGPRVRVYSPTTGAALPGPLGDFYAYDPSFTGGVFVGADNLAGDLDDDGVADLVVGPGPGLPPRVKAYSGWTGGVLADFLAFDPSMTAGVRVAAAYVTDDAKADIVVGTAKGVQNAVRVFDSTTGLLASGVPSSYVPFGPGNTSGVFVAASNDPVEPVVDTPVTYTYPIAPGQKSKYSGIVRRPDSSHPLPTGTITFAAGNYKTQTKYTLGTSGLSGLDADRVYGEVTSDVIVEPGPYSVHYDYSGDSYYTGRRSLLGGQVVNVVSDLVWEDLDYDGFQDPGEPPIGGVSVSLYKDAIPTPVLIGGTTTGADGKYKLGGMPEYPSKMFLQFQNPDPEVYGFTKVPNLHLPYDLDGDNDAGWGVSGGKTKTFYAPQYATAVWDAGLMKLASVGDYVWLDNDRDGIQDGEEKGLEGVRVELLRPDKTTLVDAKYTDSAGLYKFNKLYPGQYILRFINPDSDNLWFTTKGVGGNDKLDSDVDEDGYTAEFTLTAGQWNPNKDVGIQIPEIKITFSDGETVPSDTNDGLRVAKWHKAFKLSDPNNLASLPAVEGPDANKHDFIDRDDDRFNVWILNKAAWRKNTSILEAKIETTNVAGFTSYDDFATAQWLVRHNTKVGWYWSDSQMLVSNMVDDVYSDLDYLGTDEGSPTDLVQYVKNDHTWPLSDRTHRVALGGTVKANFNSGNPLIGKNGIFETKAPVKVFNTVNVLVNIMRVNGAPVVAKGDVEQRIKMANEQFAQVGIRLVATIQEAEPPPGLNMAQGINVYGPILVMTQDEKTLLGDTLLRDPAQQSVVVYYVNNMIPFGPGESFTQSTFGEVYADSVIVTKSVADNQPPRPFFPFTLPHEIGHVLLNDLSHAQEDANLPHPRRANLMYQPTHDRDEVIATKRLTVEQEQKMRSRRPNLLHAG